MKIYVVGGDLHYTNFIKNVEIVDKLEDAQLIIFTGGEDVTPSMYNCKKDPNTYCNPARDKKEKVIFDKINPKTQVCVGFCRGSQFLCCMNGGILVQDVNNHALFTTHPIVSTADDDRVYEITSTHHQMQYPFDLDDDDYEILYISYHHNSDYYIGDKIVPEEIYGREPEIVLYHKENLPKCLAVQGHPEMIPDSLVAEMINDLIKDLVK